MTDQELIDAEVRAGSTFTSVQYSPGGWFVASLSTRTISGATSGATVVKAMANVVRAFGEVTRATTPAP